MNNKDSQDKTNYRLHIQYIIGISITAIAITIVAAASNNNEFVGQVSFAGTISSIILSVIAIIMTITGESESKKAKDTIISMTFELEKIVKDVKSATDELENTASKEDINALTKKFDAAGIFNSITEKDYNTSNEAGNAYIKVVDNFVKHTNYLKRIELSKGVVIWLYCLVRICKVKDCKNPVNKSRKIIEDLNIDTNAIEVAYNFSLMISPIVNTSEQDKVFEKYITQLIEEKYNIEKCIIDKKIEEIES